jgi:hypothetical protein
MCIDHFEVKKETLFEKYQNINSASLGSYQGQGLYLTRARLGHIFKNSGTVPVPVDPSIIDLLVNGFTKKMLILMF